MALSVIIVLYVCVGILAAAGSIFISQKLFSAKAEQIFFALFLVAIAAFYLAFTTYFKDQGAWRLETEAVVVFAVFGILGLRLPVVLIIGYCLHGFWDVLHEVHAFGGTNLFGAHQLTELPLAYGAFCAAYDWCVAGYFYTRRREWNAAWKAHAR
jgi:predicted ABC-type exoprotein transport system permease subunit